MRLRTLPAMLAAVVLGAPVAADVNVRDTRFLQQPATSGTHVAFVYADDLWVARIDGSEVRRLTTDDGVESMPAFSPDGAAIAFSAQYDGNTDVFVVPTEGGVPRRLTWHPGPDEVQGFTPDGKRILFTSARAVFTNRYSQLFTVSLDGGMPEALPIPNAASGAYSPDGRRIAYNPLGPRFEQWKQYRGGTVSRIWLYDVASHAIEKVPQPATRANDVDAMWMGGVLYFRSDRAGEFNLFSYTPGQTEVRQLTTHRDFPILSASAGGGKIVYEQAGYLHLFDPATGATRRIAFGVSSDLRETRPRFVKGTQWIRNAAISPAGARVAFEFRGEIVTVPAEKGDARNLTSSPGAHERSPAWSPDGTRLAYFSDVSGEYAMHIAPQDGKGEVRALRAGGAGFYTNLRWSPDSRMLAYTDNAQALYVMDVETGTTQKVAAAEGVRPAEPRHVRLVAGFPLAGLHGQHAGPGDDAVGLLDRPEAFVPDHRWPRRGEQSGVRSPRTISLPVRIDRCGPGARLVRPVHGREPPHAQRVPGGAAQRSALAAGETERRRKAGRGQDRKAGRREQGQIHRREAVEPVRIDFDGIEYRILDLPVPAGDLSSLQVGTSGQLYYLRASADGAPTPASPGPPLQALHRFDLEKRADERILEQARDFQVSADGKKLLYSTRETWSLVTLSPTQKINPADGRLAVGDIEVRIDPRAEWAQIFDEAWRINRDYFYAANMHGVDWPAMKEKYGALLPDAAARSDVNRVIQWMSSELTVGHHRGGGGDRLETAKSVKGGLLGADYAVANGRYRFAKVYGGLNWNPELRSPLTEPGSTCAPASTSWRSAVEMCGRPRTCTASSRTRRGRSSN